MGHIEKFKNFSRNRVNSIKNLSWEDVKSFGNRSWDFLKRESNETKQAAEILNKMISGRDVTENEKKFLDYCKENFETEYLEEFYKANWDDFKKAFGIARRGGLVQWC